MVRLKNRYLLVNILYPDTAEKQSAVIPDLVAFRQPTTDALTPQVLQKAIRAQVSELFGDYGTGAIADSLAIKYLSPATSTFILRVSRAHYRFAWAALTFMETVPVKNGKSCVFNVVHVSGTIRKAEEKAIERARNLMIRARRLLGEQSEAQLDNMFGKESNTMAPEQDSDAMMLDRDTSDAEDDFTNDDDDG